MFTKLTLFSICLAMSAGCVLIPNNNRHKAYLVLRWVEKPNTKGPSTAADPDDRIKFDKLLSYDQKSKVDFAKVKSQLREGDLVAYTMSHREVTGRMITGRVNAIGYGLLEYGHLAIIVDMPGEGLRLFSSQSFLGPNTKEDLDTLKKHNWDAYRMDKWNRVDTGRLHEFVGLAEKKAGTWIGYDFSGMFGLWNSNLDPDKPENIGHDYICSTIVLAALYYSGVQSDALRNHGYLDLCSPLQVVSSAGRLAPTTAKLVASETKTNTTIQFEPDMYDEPNSGE